MKAIVSMLELRSNREYTLVMSPISCSFCSKVFAPRTSTTKYCSRPCLYESLKGRKRVLSDAWWEAWRANPGGATPGRPKSDDWKAQLSARQKGIVRDCFIESNKARRGPKSSRWRGGPSKWKQQLKNSKAYREWRKAVLASSSECVACGSSLDLTTDHIEPIALAPHLALEVSNGQVLCKPCHYAKNSTDMRRITLEYYG